MSTVEKIKVALAKRLHKWKTMAATWKERFAQPDLYNAGNAARAADSCDEVVAEIESIRKEIEGLGSPSLESLLNQVIEKIESESASMPQHIDSHRATKIIHTLKCGLTEYGATPEDDRELRHLKVQTRSRWISNPRHVEVLLYYWSAVEPLKEDHAGDAVIIGDLIAWRLIYIDPASKTGFKLTPAGETAVWAVRAQVP